MPSVEVSLISCPVIDLDSFINKIITHTGHIVTTGIDASKLSLKHHPKFLAALGQLKAGKQIHPREVTNMGGHLSFSFLIHANPRLLLDLAEFDITLTTAKAKTGYLALATGTLNQWQVVMAADNPVGSKVKNLLSRLGF